MCVGLMARAYTYRKSNFSLRERLKQKEAELSVERGLREQWEMELATERSMKDNAAQALFEIETEKTDINHAYRYAVQRNQWLTADNANLSTKLKTLEARLKFETERADNTEAHLNSRPTEEAAIRKFKGSAEFVEAAKVVVGQDVAVAAAEIARLEEEVSTTATELASLRNAGVATAAEISWLTVELEVRAWELAESKRAAKRRKRKARSLEKRLAEFGQVYVDVPVVDNLGVGGGSVAGEVVADSVEGGDVPVEGVAGGDEQVVENVPTVRNVVASDTGPVSGGVGVAEILVDVMD